MAINTNTGGALEALPRAPDVPSSLGNLDIGKIYDSVAAGQRNVTGLVQGTRTGIDQAELLKTAVQQQVANRSLIPSATAATAAANQGVVDQTPAQSLILASRAKTSQQTQPSDAAAINAKNNEAKLNSDLGSIYAKSGITFGADQADQLNATKGRLLLKISQSPGGVVNEPITGPNGVPIGSMVGYVGANGPEFHAVPIPFGQMARINTGIQYQKIGPKIDPVSGQSIGDQYMTVYPNAAGGITKGQVVTVAPGSAAPGDIYQPQGSAGVVSPNGSPDGSTSAPPGNNANPGAITAPVPNGPSSLPGASTIGTTVPGGRMAAQFQQKQAEERAKQRTDALADIATQRNNLSQNSFAIGKLASDIKAEQDTALGSGPVAGSNFLATFRPTAAAVNSDLSNFVGQVMASARNIRTQREFNAFTGAVPTAGDLATVQNEKLNYLQAANGALQQRNDYKEQALRANPNLDPDQVDQQAVAKFPFPTPKGGWTQHPDGTPIEGGANAGGPGAPNSAPAAAPSASAVGQGQVITNSAAVTPQQARAMPPGVSYHVIGGPVDAAGRPLVYQNPEPVAATPVVAPAAATGTPPQ